MELAHSFVPHLVLCNGEKKPRITLAYKREDGCLTILSLQMERTEYIRKGRLTYWLRPQQREATKKLKEELGGTHPSKFIFPQFLCLNKAGIRRGLEVCLDLCREEYADREIFKNYMPLIDRYFNKHPVFVGDLVRFKLKNENQQVKAILGG